MKKTALKEQPTRTEKILYSHVERQNRRFAMTYGRKAYGSQSAYVNHLIDADRRRKRQAQKAKAA
jgi:hypothetical protein